MLLGLLLMGVLFYPRRGVVYAHPEYALQTGQPCQFCHLDPGGGGVLNERGEAFRTRGHRWPLPSRGSYLWHRVLNLFFGWLHIVAAVAWLGAILFVHLILSPRTVAQGIPRRELVYSWVSITILAGSGIYLALNKFNSWSELFTTHFGHLFLVKCGLFLLMVTIAALTTFFLNPRLQTGEGSVDESGEEGRVFSLEELGQYDGQEGRATYVAVKGRVYDLSASKLWKDGVHMARHHAGTVLDEALARSPHGEKPLDRMPCIGTLKIEMPSLPPLPYRRIFLTLAYLNLFLAFAVIFCVVLWRW